MGENKARADRGNQGMDAFGQWVLPILQIVWIDLLLSGDNAVVIAMACRGLPYRQRRIGILLGALAAVAMRVAFTGVTSTLIAIPLLKIVSGLLLLWIAVKLLTEEVEDHVADENAATDRLWKAVWTIVVADIVMSLDNVIAITAAAKGHWGLIVFGLLLSIPLVIFGSTLISGLIKRFPVIVWGGAALLGWIAGEIFVDDALIRDVVHGPVWHYGVAITGVAIVLVVGALLRQRAKSEAAASA
jgi:YjbE family integral membrane protein